MFQVTFLGTSGGVPTVERGMPGIAVKYEGTLMLWDCGEGTQRQLMRYKVGYGSVSQIYVTHPHLDHYLGIFGMLETLKLSSASPPKVSIHSPDIFSDDTQERYSFVTFSRIRKGVLCSNDHYEISAFPVRHCRSSYGLVFQEAASRKFYEEKAHKLGIKGRLFKEIQKKGSVEINGKRVSLEDVTWLRKGRKIVYSGDCRPSDATLEAAKDADLLIHESTFECSKKEEAEERLHTTAEEAAELAKKAGVKKLILTHISPRYSDSEILLKEAKAVFVQSFPAFDGMQVDVCFSE